MFETKTLNQEFWRRLLAMRFISIMQQQKQKTLRPDFGLQKKFAFNTIDFKQIAS